MTLWRRIGDALNAFAHGPAASEAGFRRLSAEARELTIELHDAMEKLGSWVAREAKRQSRAAHKSLDDAAAPPVAPPTEGTAAVAGGDRKTQLRLMAHQRGLL